MITFKYFKALQSIAGLQNVETAVFELGCEARTHDLVVVNDQQRGTGTVHWVSRQTTPGTG